MKPQSVFIIIFSIFSFVSPVSADEEKVALSTNSFVWTSTLPLTLPDVLSHFETFDRDLKTLTAEFTQSLAMLETGMSSSVEGSIVYKKPEHLRIEYSRPEPQTVVTDGKDIWIHRPAHGQVIQSLLEDWKKSDPTINNLMQFGSYGKMLKNYDVVLDSGPAAIILHLTPKDSPGADFRLSLELNDKTLFPETTVLGVGSMVARTILTNIRFNPKVEDKTFDFKPPPGADVFRNFKPPVFSQ